MKKYDELRDVAALIRKCKLKLKELGILTSKEVNIMKKGNGL
ncbi:hypothetical protein [Rossellomorea marisflavi]